MDGEQQSALRARLPNDFLVRVMLRYCKLNRENSAKPKKLVPCTYHEHATEAEKAACAKKDG
jgi:hypothetical protein